jgi:hypothetical protein
MDSRLALGEHIFAGAWQEFVLQHAKGAEELPQNVRERPQIMAISVRSSLQFPLTR